MAQLIRKIGGSLVDIADTFDETGLAPASMQVRSLIHKAIEPLEHNLAWMKLPKSKLPDSSLFTVLDLNRPNRYRYVVKVFYFDQERNVLTDKFISFYTDDLKSLDELMSDYKAYDPLSESDVQLQIINYEFWEGYHNEGKGWE